MHENAPPSTRLDALSRLPLHLSSWAGAVVRQRVITAVLHHSQKYSGAAVYSAAAQEGRTAVKQGIGTVLQLQGSTPVQFASAAQQQYLHCRRVPLCYLLPLGESGHQLRH